MYKSCPPQFYLGDDEESRSAVGPKRPVGPAANVPLGAPVGAPPTPSIADVLLFPIENSHAYSYAHLSPNLLALRLNVLKRSLEILNERPEWFKSIGVVDDAEEEVPAPQDVWRRPQFPALLRNGSRDSLPTDKLKLRPNASSAALLAFFRPKMARTESMPVLRCSFDESLEEEAETPVHGDILLGTDNLANRDPILSDDLKDVIELLEKDSSVISHNSDIASTLHDLSLSSNEESLRRKQDLLKTKMLYALALPFVETATAASSPWELHAGPGLDLPNASTTALSLLDSMQQPQAATAAGNRPFHAISSGKRTSPQSVVTVEAEFPWGFRAANDLACLMFGVLKNMIRNLTLMDLIAPQFRHFVTERMSRAGTDRRAAHDIIFAGEIIAISRQAEGGFAWTSMWAKRRGDLVICMFEQITCDAFDVVVLRDAECADSSYVITNVDEIAGKLITKLDASGITQLNVLSELLATDLSRREAGASDVRDSDLVNSKRYYTVQLNSDDNIPCALTSYPLEKDDTKFEVKLKIHLMPYIAGMFVVDFNSFHVLSCNKAIAKNLFGISSDVIVGHSINNIIPRFSEILRMGLDHDESTRITPGLVLPEHFFRMYHAYLKHTRHSNRTADELFVSSRGIDGRHRDGKTFYIDVQLRVILNDVFVLWVTYSRHTDKSISRQLHKLSSASSLNLKGSGALLAKSISSPGTSSSKVDLPSQLKLFPKNESELLELASGSPSISRHSSLRRPKKANTFAVPVTYMGDAIYKNALLLRINRVVSASEQRLAPETDVEEPVTPVEGAGTADGKHYTNLSEAQVLAMENEELAEQQRRSKFWPTEIGARKRTKKYEEFTVVKKMGEGAYGKVVLAEHKEDPEYKVIIKCIDKLRILVDTWVRDRQLGTIPSEIQVMATLNHEPHPNIMRIIDYFEDPNYYYLETPIFGHPPAIDLFDYIEVKKDMTELDCQLIFRQVVLAIYHLHKHGIVHRDIKDENIIVNEFGVIKLIDFGSAGYVKLGPFDVFVGTIDYASPEVLRGEKYDGKPQDIWALGILLYTMIYKENPFYNVDEIMEGTMRVPFVVSDSSLNLIQLILNREVSQRPTITDIADHDWLDI